MPEYEFIMRLIGDKPTNVPKELFANLYKMGLRTGTITWSGRQIAIRFSAAVASDAEAKADAWEAIERLSAGRFTVAMQRGER